MVRREQDQWTPRDSRSGLALCTAGALISGLP
jgi:hypothetical protein